MSSPYGEWPFSLSGDGAAERGRSAATGSSAAPSFPRRHVHILIASTLAFALSQGCAAVGVALLGTAATTATKTGISYTIDSRAQKTFAAPVDQVKQNIVAALQEMAFLVEAQEKGDDGERIVATVDGRVVKVDLEAVTPNATKVGVIVNQGWFWKDRATAEEIIEQAGRGVEAAVAVARAGGGRVLSAVRKTPDGGELRGASTAWEPWDPQRWREGYSAAPAPPGMKSPAVGPAAFVPAVSHSLIYEGLFPEDRLRRCPQDYVPSPWPLRQGGREPVPCGRVDVRGAPQVP